MAKVNVTNVVVLDNPSSFFSSFQFELTFECIKELKDDLEWKMIYVGSADSMEYDQVLDTIYVGPVPEGQHVFVFQADPPDASKIPEADAVGVTIVLLTCSYRGQEFVRVGYFVNNDYADPEMRENPPPKPLFDRLTRNILESKPRVTRFKINWDDASSSGALTNGNGQAYAPKWYVGTAPLNSVVAAASLSMRPQNGPMDDTMDDDSLAMTMVNGVTALNENSDSLTMEC